MFSCSAIKRHGQSSSLWCLGLQCGEEMAFGVTLRGDFFERQLIHLQFIMIYDNSYTNIVNDAEVFVRPCIKDKFMTS